MQDPGYTTRVEEGMHDGVYYCGNGHAELVNEDRELDPVLSNHLEVLGEQEFNEYFGTTFFFSGNMPDYYQGRKWNIDGTHFKGAVTLDYNTEEMIVMYVTNSDGYTYRIEILEDEENITEEIFIENKKLDFGKTYSSGASSRFLSSFLTDWEDWRKNLRKDVNPGEVWNKLSIEYSKLLARPYNFPPHLLIAFKVEELLNNFDGEEPVSATPQVLCPIYDWKVEVLNAEISFPEGDKATQEFAKIYEFLDVDNDWLQRFITIDLPELDVVGMKTIRSGYTYNNGEHFFVIQNKHIHQKGRKTFESDSFWYVIQNFKDGEWLTYVLETSPVNAITNLSLIEDPEDLRIREVILNGENAIDVNKLLEKINRFGFGIKR